MNVFLILYAYFKRITTFEAKLFQYKTRYLIVELRFRKRNNK